MFIITCELLHSGMFGETEQDSYFRQSRCDWQPHRVRPVGKALLALVSRQLRMQLTWILSVKVGLQMFFFRLIDQTCFFSDHLNTPIKYIYACYQQYENIP